MESRKIIDLHTHTCFSDGDLTPNQLVTRAHNLNLSDVAITDHDTLLGVQALDRSEVPSDINVVDGIELTAKVSKGRMHILGLGLDIYDPKLNGKMEELQNNSLYSVISYINQLKKDYGIIFSTEDIRSILNTNKNIGRPDLALLCVKYGYATDVNDAFEKYLIDVYKKVRPSNKGLTYADCLKLINDAGGVAVLAHPHSLELSDLELYKLLRDMIDLGLKGIEVFHSNHSEEEMKKYFEMSQELGLLYSGGSDYHGVSVKPDIELGVGRGNILIKKLSVLDYLKNR